MRAVMILAVALALAGCGVSKYSFSCTGGGCEVSTSGKAKVDFEDEYDTILEVRGIGDDNVTLSCETDEETVETGETKQVGALQVTVKSISGNDVKMHVE